MVGYKVHDEALWSTLRSHIVSYPTPVNLNYLWSFGSLSGIFLGSQILTGVFLAMHYTPNVFYAFNSIEHIMRDVSNGWLIRYLHSNGASFFFFFVFFHIARGIYYGSYVERSKLWVLGVLIFICMMATGFMGYILPWGQMSFWGATVITNLFSSIPFVGVAVVEWLWGGFSIDNATLNRFFSLHYLLPFIIAILVIIHLAALHEEGSTNPISVEKYVDVVPFYPYFYVKDLLAFFGVLCCFIIIVCFYPNVLGHPDNYIPANAMVTPVHIVPEWYFLPFYAILRTIPDKLLGVIAMFLAIVLILLLPFLNLAVVKSVDYRYFLTHFYWFFFVIFLILGWIGQKPVEDAYITVGFFSAYFYFCFLTIFLSIISLLEEFCYTVYYFNLKSGKAQDYKI